MAPNTQRPATYQDIVDLPEHLVGEIINGELITHSRPAPRQLLAKSQLGAQLVRRFSRDCSGPTGWWVLDEPELHFERNVLVPDVTGWRRERMPRLPETAWFEQAPDWLCEVLSPATARVDRVQKLPLYAAAGVRHVWLVDPALRTLEAYENQQGRWLQLGVFKDDDAVAVAPFEVFTLELGALWD